MAIHPRAHELAGVPTYPSLLDVAGDLDLVVICVPAGRVLDVFRDAVAAGVRAAVIVSSGFGELGAEGARIQHDLATLARAHDVRVVGPNCLGLLCNHPDLRLNATFHSSVPPVGGLAVASQSGGVGIVLMDLARELGLGVHTFVSLGNKADVSSNDLLAAWYDDPEVTAAALYLESFGNSAKFARFARRFARRKPLLAVVGGRSAGGSRAGASHTAAAATPGVGVDALFAQAGVIACRDAEDLARTAVLLTEQPRPAGRRLAILSNAGGIGVLAADAAADEGFDVVEFSTELQRRLGELVHGTTGTSNPVDAGAGVSPTELADLFATVLGSGEVDAVLVVPVATGVTDGSLTMTELARARAQHPEIPVVGVPLGGSRRQRRPRPRSPPTGPPPRPCGPSAAPSATPSGWPTSPSLRDSATPRSWWQRASGSVPRWREWTADGSTQRRARSSSTPGASRCWGPPPTRPPRPWSAPRGLGFPVAVKVTDAGVVHKTELGLVRTGLRTREQVRRGLPRLPDRRRPRPPGPGAADGLGHGDRPRAGAGPVDGPPGHGGQRWRGHRRVGRPRIPGAPGARWPRRREPSARCGSRGCWRASGERPPVTSPG